MIADRTLERTLLGVHEHVTSQGRCLPVGFFANFAPELARIVRGHVARVGHFRLEPFATSIAQEVGLVGVQCLVGSIGLGGTEHLLTEGTFEGFGFVGFNLLVRTFWNSLR